jgi:hypothetical protein
MKSQHDYNHGGKKGVTDNTLIKNETRLDISYSIKAPINGFLLVKFGISKSTKGLALIMYNFQTRYYNQSTSDQLTTFSLLANLRIMSITKLELSRQHIPYYPLNMDTKFGVTVKVYKKRQLHILGLPH